MRSRPYLTHVEESMIASAVAGGQPLCCAAGRQNRETVSDQPGVWSWLSEVAYERTGCSGAAEAVNEPERADIYLRNIWPDLGCEP